VSSTHSRAVELPRCHAGKARQLGHYENAGERERERERLVMGERERIK